MKRQPVSFFAPWMVALAASGLVLAGTSLAPGQTSTDFNRDIRPIFARHCTACHGGVKAAGEVSFVYRAKALAAITPGKPAESELLRRVRSTDPEEVMPKPSHGPRLSERDIATLERWIAEGATWSEPWSFVRPEDPPAPQVKQADWPRTKADALVLARLEARGMSPASAASPAEWLRRVTLDLTGLPPTPAEWEAFAREFAERPAAAREQVVDRLLESRHYGERWASVWLDLARYSDTFGYEKDPHRDIWPWRDWVIRAFNSDLPFDQFTIKQLAGDLLPDPSADDLLATAFHRNTQCNTEGGTDDEEYRLQAVIDRVNTTWIVWQGTTFGCVRCHAHPYDPFPQRDYYRFLALLNNTEDCDQNDDFPRAHLATDPARQMDIARAEVQARNQRRALNQNGVALAAQVTDWQPLAPSSAKSSGGTLTIGDGGRIQAGGTLPIGVVYTLVLPAAPVTALRLSISPDSDDPTKWPERGSILSQIELTYLTADGQRKAVPLREVFADSLAGPYDPQDSLHEDPGGFGDFPVLRGPRWAVVVLEQPLAATAGPELERGQLEIVLRQKAASNSGFQACTIRRFQLERSNDERWTRLAADETRRAQWEQWRRQRSELSKAGGPLVPVLLERPSEARRETRVFTRGNLLVKGEAVEAGLPEVFGLPAPPATAPLTRLDLARWLVSDANTLTARVVANRWWAELMGRGIVETLEDFGTSGTPPSHPELLDHLAVRLAGEFRWSLKKFLRELALSATYGQTARVTPERLEQDPGNVWYARGPRARLTAEMVRDQALVVSGLWSPKQFGPPVYPPQPAGVWNTVYSGAEWKTSTGEDRYRRAIYTYCKRTSGYPALLTFDAPTRDVCTPRRVATNTPLQALVTLNDPAFIELAQAFARRLDEAGGTPADKVARGYRWLTLHDPPPAALQALTQLYDAAVSEFQADPANSQRLAATPQVAALVLVANTMFNMDAALVR